MRARRFVLPFLLALAVSVSSPATAATHTWTGAVDGAWSKGGNWTPNIAPAALEESLNLVFPAVATTKTMVNDIPSLSILSITFSDSAYALSGQAFTLSSGITLDAGTNEQSLHISNAITLGGNVVFALANKKDLALDGVLSGSFGFTMTKTAGGTDVLYLHVTNANTFTGIVTAGTGYLFVENALGLGVGDGTPATGTVVQAGGLVRLANVTVANERLSLTGSGANGNGTIQTGGGTNAWNGPIVLASGVLVNSPSPLTFGGVISGPFGMSYAPAGGAITYGGASTYAGPTSIAGAGPFTVTGSLVSGVVLNNGGTGSGGLLAGTGSVGPVTGGFPGGASQRVSPGVNAGDAGRLTTGDLVLNAPAGLTIDLKGTAAGTQYDQVKVTGAVNIADATLTTALGGGFVPAAGDTFVIVDNDGSADPVIGTFTGLPSGATFQLGGQTLQISYTGGDGNDIVLKAGTPNQLPTIQAGADLSRTKGGPVTAATIATVGDPDTPVGSLVVTVASTFSGAIVTNIVNTAGTITANVGVECGSPVTSGFVNLLVSDGTSSVPASLTVNVVSDGAPTVTPPADITLSQSTCQGGVGGATLQTLQTKFPSQGTAFSTFLAGGSATDPCTASPTRLTARLGDSDIASTTFFPAGTSQATFRFQDGDGQIGTAAANVVVRRQGDLDLNGTVDVFDVVIMASQIVGNVTAGTAPFLAPLLTADANGNGVVDVFDLVLAASFVVGNTGCLTP